jgi:(S)-mandelate dehydrogenase
LAAAGDAGVDHVVRLLKDEVDRTPAQTGFPTIDKLSVDYIVSDAVAFSAVPQSIHALAAAAE